VKRLYTDLIFPIPQFKGKPPTPDFKLRQTGFFTSTRRHVRGFPLRVVLREGVLGGQADAQAYSTASSSAIVTPTHSLQA
jgi:hypothetical protein